MNGKTGILLCGHGSRDEGAIREFAVLAKMVAERLPDYDVEHAFLEFATPVIREGLDALRAKGNARILAVPGMLFAAGHVKNDIPSVLNSYAARNGGFDVRYGRSLDIDLKMLRAAGDRIREALAAAPGDVPAHETLLVVVGRGASDPDANSNVAKITRMLWEGFGFGWAETCYSGVTFPLVEPGLEHAVRLGFKRIVVFPYFLFTGILVRRIYDHTDIVAARHPEVQFVKAPYLNVHPLVVETVLDRIDELMRGSPNMNCQLCKYREQMLGFEADVGLPQESHHHHVEGIGTGTAAQDGAHGHHHPGHDHGHGHAHHGHDHGHGHGHSHGHHPPYPHADHPLGPVTLKALEARKEGEDD